MAGRFAELARCGRDAAWLTPERARAYCTILAVASVTLGIAALALSRNGLDPAGRPLGVDFPSFWAASQLALNGTPEQAYHMAPHLAAQRAIFGGADIGYSAFFYPPTFLLVCLPLAALPYLPSLFVWLGASFLAFFKVLRQFLGPGREVPLAVLAFPAVLVNIGHGQNGFLTAALFGGGILATAKRPILAGLLFGCLIIKPHLALLIPLVLAARGAWTAFLATGATALALIVLSAAIFGVETWEGFLAAAPLARQALEQGLVEPEKMQSAFAAIRVLGGSAEAAYAVQAAVALIAAALLVVLARAGAEPLTQGAALAAATLLATPFLLDYDLTLLAIPLAWLYGEGKRTGFLPWEKALLLAGFLLPLVSRLTALAFGIPLGPPVLAAIFVLVLRRGLAEARPQVWPVSPFPGLPRQERRQ
jgi:alpha-1,2-mannosyltransferase